MTLYNTLLQQIGAMYMMQKKPYALKIDLDSADALMRELGNGILITEGQRIAGLDIQITNEPSFEVVDAETFERDKRKRFADRRDWECPECHFTGGAHWSACSLWRFMCDEHTRKEKLKTSPVLSK